MTSEDIKATAYSREEIAQRLLSFLDAKDGSPDNKISKAEWNLFADYAGLKPTDKDFVRTEDVTAGLDTLMSNNPAKAINYARSYFGETMLLKHNAAPKRKTTTAKKKTVELPKSSFDKFVDGAKSFFSTKVRRVRDGAKSYADNKLEKFIVNSSKEEVQAYIRKLADMTDDKYPVAAKLLRMSVTDEEMSLGRHSDYVVLNASQGKKALAIIGMHEDDINPYGHFNEHLTADQMKWKTAVFNKNSEAAKMVNRTAFLKEKIREWISEGRPNKKYYGGALKENMDCLLGINSCLITVTGVKDNGSTKTYTGYLEDVYDFGESYKPDNITTKTEIIDSVTHVAHIAQRERALVPYRILIPFEVTM